MKKFNSILWGIVLIAIGIVFALNTFGITDINVFFDGWWTLFIIIPCAIGLFSKKDKMGNLIGIAAGVLLLLACQDILSFGMLLKLILPALIIIIGVKLILGGIFGNKHGEAIKKIKENGAELKNGSAFFSGQDINFAGQTFEGAELNAVFGGIKCDITNALIEKDCIIKASAIFGGIDILVPQNVNVIVRSSALFGGVSDKTKNNSKDNTITVYIEGNCMFGGIDVK